MTFPYCCICISTNFRTPRNTEDKHYSLIYHNIQMNAVKPFGVFLSNMNKITMPSKQISLLSKIHDTYLRVLSSL